MVGDPFSQSFQKEQVLTGLEAERGNDTGKAEAGLEFDRSCNLIYHPPD